jgi:ferritin-like metal-binding protein YciE
MIGKRAQAKTCEVIKGILEEGGEIMEEYAGSEALDAGLRAGGQAVEHYEMSRYGTLKTWAIQLGMNDASALPQSDTSGGEDGCPSQQIGANESQSEVA